MITATWRTRRVLGTVLIMRRVEVAGVHLDRGSDTPVVMLREVDAPHRVLPIRIGGPDAASIALALAGHVPPRPLAHDVMAGLVGRSGSLVEAAELLEVRHGTFIAQLSMLGPSGTERIDIRASDAIALAMRVGAPVLVDDRVMDEASASPNLLDDDFDEGFDEGFDDDFDDDAGPDAMNDLDRSEAAGWWLPEASIEAAVQQFSVFLEHVVADDFALGHGF
jgi:uncharacterized protein